MLKVATQILKVLFLFSAFLISVKQGIKKSSLIYFFIILSLAMLSFDKILFEILLTLILISTLHKQRIKIDTIKYFFVNLLYLTFMITLLVILLSYLNVLPEKVYDNPFATEEMAMVIATSKKTLGFWNPNITSSFIASSFVMSAILMKRRLFFASLLLFIITFPSLMGKTYFVIVITFVLLSILVRLRYKLLIKLGAYLSWLVAACILLSSYILVFPSLIRKYTSTSLFNTLDLITSFRLSIAERATQNISEIQLLTGFWLPKDYIDSGLANLNFSMGVILASLVYLLYLSSMYKNLKYGNYNIVYLLMCFILVNLFESLIFFNSILFVFVCYVIINSFSKDNLRVLHVLTTKTGRRI